MAKTTVSTSELKANCSRILDGVARRRVPVVITKRGHPVAKLVPIDEEISSLFGFARGCITIQGDIVSPLEEEWEASES
ncbi:MAG: type II toxin-antitoxin system Phd/YefM family antitoxin [Deltaproteobacteria bacterium]|nr:type II toxin-antitoxin system Phd/YefM family antitoxin [Deltaproteobacteria bacterium]